MIKAGFGSDEQFATLRKILADSGYVESAILARTGAKRLDQIVVSAARQESAPPLEDTLDSLIWLLLEGRTLPDTRRNLLPKGLAELLAEFGLLDDQWRCPIGLYPTEGLYLISDRANETMDSVYPAIEDNSRRFLDVIPRSKCGSLLDLCAGTGVAALVAARDFAKSSYGCDLGGRATLFAEFNRRLNGLANAQIAQGNLYEPYAGQMFDCIVSHPPHVPVLKPKHLFSDGGDDGEQVGKSIVEGLAAHLSPGGQFCLLTMGADTKDAPFEQRARGWLGEAQREFDIALVARKLVEPGEFITGSVMRGTTRLEQIDQWKALFRSRGITTLVYGTLLMSRKTESRAPFTVRRQSSNATHRRTEMDWLLQWERQAANGTAAKMALQSKLAARPGSGLRVLNELKNGHWAAAEYLLQVDYPFHVERRTQPWIAHLLSLCNGTTTGLDQLTRLISEGLVAPGTTPEQFAQALVTLISEGFVLLASGSGMINSL